MAHIVDTIPTFDEFARRAFLDSPVVRDQRWRGEYEGAHPEVFEAFYAKQGPREGTNPLVRELSRIRQRALEAAPVMRELIEQLQPAVGAALGLPPAPAPHHVLLVGPLATNAVVGRLDGEVTLFHCLEWYQDREGASVLVAHEDTHAWHEIALGPPPPENDLVWTAFSEGLAIQTSRAVVPGRPEEDYFWYGHPGFEDWLPWCQEHRRELLDSFRRSIDDEGASENFFGGGLVEGRWRVGYFVADALVAALRRELPALAGMSVDEGRAAVRAALAALA